MAIQRRVCAELAPPPAYSHVVTVSGATSVWTAGAVPIGAAEPASTLLGMERLGYPGQLVEIEAVAAV